MKRILSVMFACMFFCSSVYSETDTATHELHINKGDLHVVLKAYANLAGLVLEESAEVKKMDKVITVHSDHKITINEMLKMLEDAVKEQAGVVIKPLGGKRVLATLEKK